MTIAIRRMLVIAALSLLPLTGLAQSSSAEPPNGDQAAKREKFAERMKEADANGDHMLSKDEMSKGMPRMAAHFDEIDADHDGKVSVEELRAYMRAHKGERRQHGGM